MCGRFVVDYKTNREIQDRIEDGWTAGEALRDVLGSEFPSYSVAPTNQVPILGDHRIDLAQWGFKRVFGGRKQNLINARMDRVATARTWKKPLLTSRCIVPMGGYYEWVDKKPWYISGTTSLWAAGMFEHRDDGMFFTILTTEGHDEAGRVHDRMPAFLTDDLWDDWVGGELTEPEAADLLGALDESVQQISQGLDAWRVSTAVNTVRVDKADAGLIERV